MSILSTIARQDGFYGGSIEKFVDGEKRYFFIAFFFVNDYIFFQMDQVENPISIDKTFVSEVREQHHKISTAVLDKEITPEENPRELSRYTETPESLSAQFLDGSDDVKLILLPRFFNGVLLYMELEGYQIDWFDHSNSGFKKRVVIEGAKISFFHY